MNRRNFLGGLAILGCQGMLQDPLHAAVPTPKKRTKVMPASEWDDNLVVIISDLHTHPAGYQPDKLRRVVDDIINMAPKPRNVLALGDLAYLQGKRPEYELLREIVAPLAQAGISLTMAMGNHDRRDHFCEYFPLLAQQTLVPGKLVFRVETPRAVFILLDSSQKGKGGEDDFIVAGMVDEAQKEWLKNQLASETKPAFVMAHHPISETKLQKILLESPTCSGYIYGHDHRWRKDWVHLNYSDRLLMRTLCSPSTGHWGDIGYTCLRLDEKVATAELHQYEFYFPSPVRDGQPIPEEWQLINEEHSGAQCRFVYRG